MLSIVLVAIVSCLSGCRSRTAPTPGTANLQMPDQEARDFTLTETSEGTKNWTLWASYAAMYNAKNLVDAKTVRIEFFDSKGKKYSTLVAMLQSASSGAPSPIASVSQMNGV